MFNDYSNPPGVLKKRESSKVISASSIIALVSPPPITDRKESKTSDMEELDKMLE
jgi:hypothetical protein